MDGRIKHKFEGDVEFYDLYATDVFHYIQCALKFANSPQRAMIISQTIAVTDDKYLSDKERPASVVQYLINQYPIEQADMAEVDAAFDAARKRQEKLKREADERKAAYEKQSDEWRKHGLCYVCGAEIGLFGRCKGVGKHKQQKV